MREQDMIECTFVKDKHQQWWYRETFQKYAPLQKVLFPEMLMPLTLRHEITTPQSQLISFRFMNALTDLEQARYIKQLLPHLFEPLTIRDNRPRCRYEDGGSIPVHSGHTVEIPAHHSARMDDRGSYWECPVCGWAKEKGVK